MTEGRRGGEDSRPEENAPGGPRDPGPADGAIPAADPEQPAPAGDALTWYQRGLDLLAKGSPAAAAQLLERAADAEPDSRMVREALARAQFDAGWYSAAADSFRMIVEASPADDYAHFGLGLALARSGAPGAAAEYLALAAAMRPDLPHYTGALRGVRATLRAREQSGETAGAGGMAGAGETAGAGGMAGAGGTTGAGGSATAGEGDAG